METPSHRSPLFHIEDVRSDVQIQPDNETDIGEY